MLDAPSLKNLLAASLAAVVALFAASAPAVETVNISLNVHYATSSDPNSGGTWDLVAKSTAFGIAGLSVKINNIVPTLLTAPAATVNGNNVAGFAEFDYQTSTHTLDIGQVPIIPPLGPGQEENVFYGVGTLQYGAPDYPGKPFGSISIGPSFSNLINLLGEIPWASTPDFLGDSTWDSAARFVAGTFPTGVTPAFLTGSTANVFISLPPDNFSFGNIGEASVSVIRRTNLVLQNADFNHDGRVNAADYVVWRSMLGQTGLTPGSGADGNGDGNVDFADYNLWRAHFGGTSGAGAGDGASLSTNPIPEPASVVMLAFGTLLAWLMLRTRGLSPFAQPAQQTVPVPLQRLAQKLTVGGISDADWTVSSQPIVQHDQTSGSKTRPAKSFCAKPPLQRPLCTPQARPAKTDK